jgi:hypothetical protein
VPFCPIFLLKESTNLHYWMALLSKVNITAKVYILSTIKTQKMSGRQVVRALLNISAILLKYPTFDEDFFHIFMSMGKKTLNFGFKMCFFGQNSLNIYNQL